MSAVRDDLCVLTQAMRRHLGAGVTVENIVIPTLGGVNRTIIFDCVDGTARRRMVSRQSTYEGEGNPFVRPQTQFKIMEKAFQNGFPVPEPIVSFEPDDGLGEGFVSAFVQGETMPKRIVSGPEFDRVRPKLARQSGELLAQLHSIDFTEVRELSQLPDSVDPLAAQRSRYDTYNEAHPAIEIGLRWLELHRLNKGDRVLLHGDFRTGNLMLSQMGIEAVLDWECCHIGDPAEDLGWLCTRSWRFDRPDRIVGGFGELEDLLAGYADYGGRRITIEEVHYWQVFGLVRWSILNAMQAHGHVFGGRRDVTFAACGRNASLVEYDLLMTLRGLFR